MSLSEHRVVDMPSTLELGHSIVVVRRENGMSIEHSQEIVRRLPSLLLTRSLGTVSAFYSWDISSIPDEPLQHPGCPFVTLSRAWPWTVGTAVEDDCCARSVSWLQCNTNTIPEASRTAAVSSLSQAMQALLELLSRQGSGKG